jgi:hypothetical protein
MRITDLVWVLITLGVSCMAYDLAMQHSKDTEKLEKQKVKVEYRYIPRTFIQEQLNPLQPSDAFDDMFNGIDPWQGGVALPHPRTKYNQYWISQE